MSPTTKVRNKQFMNQGRLDLVCDEAAEFASGFPPDRIISISHSTDQFTASAVVWYWILADEVVLEV